MLLHRQSTPQEERKQHSLQPSVGGSDMSDADEVWDSYDADAEAPLAQNEGSDRLSSNSEASTSDGC